MLLLLAPIRARGQMSCWGHGQLLLQKRSLGCYIKQRYLMLLSLRFSARMQGACNTPGC